MNINFFENYNFQIYKRKLYNVFIFKEPEPLLKNRRSPSKDDDIVMKIGILPKPFVRHSGSSFGHHRQFVLKSKDICKTFTPAFDF